MSTPITIQIDGRPCEATAGEMIIAVADREGIAIPRFCYHKHLSIAANCRMCLVEAEQGGRPFPKPVPACATPVADGMKVQTRSPRALEAQRGTMEFLLINHPLDCPICDQGGECELQDISMGYGDDLSRYEERKRVVKDEDFGPLIATEMTRCIHCTRCVRFGAEIAGVRELGATGRGEHMRIGTFVAHTLAHELSGNVIDLCPVGALTSKPYRFSARAWELTAQPSIAPHDGVGANLNLHVRNNRVMRVHPRDNAAVNETWIADRDRFSYEGLHAATRLTTPMVKRDGQWQSVEWSDALVAAAEALKAQGPGQLGCLVSPAATLEEQYLLGRVCRGLGSGHIDSRLRQQDFRGDPADARLPWLGVPIADLERQTAVLLVGSDIRQEQPLLAHRLRKAALDDALIAVVNPYRLALNHPSRQLVAAPDCLLLELAAVAKALDAAAGGAPRALLDQAQVYEPHRDIAAGLRAAGSAGTGLVLLGALAEADPNHALLRELARLIASAAGCRIGFLAAGPNTSGACLAGALPHRLPGAGADERPGLDAVAMLADPRSGYLLWGLEPDRDLINPQLAMTALGNAQAVVACTAFRHPSLEAVATVMLPIGAFAETAGTFVNTEGRWQRFQGAVAPPGEARPGWKLLRVLGNLLDLPGFEYASSREVHDELASLCQGAMPDNSPVGEASLSPPAIDGALTRVGPVPIYAVDALVRQAPALQHTPLAAPFAVGLHPGQAAALGLAEGARVRVRQGEASAEASIVLDAALAMGCARIPGAVAGSETLGPLCGPVTLESIAN